MTNVRTQENEGNKPNLNFLQVLTKVNKDNYHKEKRENNRTLRKNRLFEGIETNSKNKNIIYIKEQRNLRGHTVLVTAALEYAIMKATY